MTLSLIEVLAEVPDPRSRHGRRHPLPAILSLVVLAMLRGCKGPVAIAQFGRDYGIPLAHALGFTRGKTPAASCLSKLLARLDAAAFETALARWIQSRTPIPSAADDAKEKEALSLDGKTLRGSRDGVVPGQHLVAAYAPLVEAVLVQVRVDAKTNEHKAALELLGILSVKGRIVLGDAIFCQRDVCAEIVKQEGDYLFFAKANQPGLQTDIGAGFGYEAAARAVAAAFSPRRAGVGGAAESAGAQRGQGPRSAGGEDVANDDSLDAAREVAGTEARLRVDTQADDKGRDDGGGDLWDNESGRRGGERPAVAGSDTGSLGDREQVALGA
jgi:predicted transposase YbfD/YdcC